MNFLLSFAVAFIGGGLVALAAGENPFNVYAVLFQGSFGSWNGFSYTLFYATPLLFAGLAVAIPYRVGLFNIGGEGQLYAGAIGLYAATRYLPEIGIFSPLVAIAGAVLAGALWGSLPGLFRAWRGSHEVITTIMLNFVAIGLSSYLIGHHWRDVTSQSSATPPLPSSYHLPLLGTSESPLNIVFIVALAVAVWLWIFLEKTELGFRLRAVGLNPSAARMAGISVKKAMVISMMIGGALAAGVAVNEMLGHSHYFQDGFSTGYGFVGIAVAFLGRGHPLGIILSSLFFGALYKGAGDLDIETQNMTRDFAVIMQAIFIAAVACESAFGSLATKIRRKLPRWN